MGGDRLTKIHLLGGDRLTQNKLELVKERAESNILRTNVTRTNVAWAYVPNILDHLIFVNLGCMPNFSFLSYVEVGKKDVLRLGGLVVLG